MSSAEKPASDAFVTVKRGTKEKFIAGSLAFIGLRALEAPFQYALLGRGVADPLISSLGLSLTPHGSPSQTGIGWVDGLGLSPYRLALVGLNAATSAKHIIWRLYIANEPFNVPTAVAISLINTLFASINTLLFITSATSASSSGGEGPESSGWPGAPLVLGSGLVISGLVIELTSELQRKSFKDDPKNKGKPYTGGLFSLSRHINYFGYTLMRTGLALASGGWTYGAGVAAFFIYSFVQNSIPELDKYCTNRYGDMWHDYKRQVPYKLVPYVY